jgi:hypothetical protein
MNDPSDQTRWRYASGVALAVWLLLSVRLMISDVWDETNGMLLFSNPENSLSFITRFVLTKSLGFWRPLPTLVAGWVMHFLPDFDISWRVLRAVNIALLLGAMALFAKAIERWNGVFAPRDRFVYLLAALFSGSALITAGWYPIIFDAASLLAVAGGLALLSRGHSLTAGLIFGVGFFCKESTALVLPFLLVLLVSGRILWRDALRAGLPALALGLVYFAIRSQIIPFGSAADVHTFDRQYLLPTITSLAQTLWYQTTKVGPWVAFGVAFTLLALGALRRPLVIAAMVAFLGATVVVYWGMFAVPQTELIDARNFVGRLYLAPVMLFLFLLALERKTVVMAVLLIPILFGGALTYRDHARFQRMYKRIYRTAATAAQKPLVVHLPMKPLDDTVRGIKIGDFPNAPVTVNTRTGRLEYATPAPASAGVAP